MKRLFFLTTFVLILALIISGCGNNQQASNSGSTEESFVSTNGTNSIDSSITSTDINTSTTDSSEKLENGYYVLNKGTDPSKALDLKSFKMDISTVKTIYIEGAPLNYSNAFADIVLNDTNQTKIVLRSTNFKIVTNYNKDVAGEYTVKVSYPNYEEMSYKVSVFPAPKITNGVVKYSVDSNCGDNFGKILDGALHCKTVSQAISLIADSKYANDVIKQVNIAKGEYKEKLNISIPNMVFIGDTDGESKITYDDWSGKKTSSTATLGTDNSATVSISGANFMAKNIVFENSFDYINSSDSSKQALAAIVTGDKAVFESCTFLGFQDTLQAKSNRGYYHNCVIKGTTDFIFGNNSTSLFEGCQIVTRFTKENNENGGYITACKGNDGKTNGVEVPKYGYVFKGCTLTAETGVLDGSVALGRPWRADATVSWINCEMGAHISKKAYDGSDSGCRYVWMKGGKNPANANEDLKNEPQNAFFTEYGNTGTGSLTEAVNGFTMLTKEQADTYTITNIFAAINGGVTYSDSWDANQSLTKLQGIN